MNCAGYSATIYLSRDFGSFPGNLDCISPELCVKKPGVLATKVTPARPPQSNLTNRSRFQKMSATARQPTARCRCLDVEQCNTSRHHKSALPKTQGWLAYHRLQFLLVRSAQYSAHRRLWYSNSLESARCGIAIKFIALGGRRECFSELGFFCLCVDLC